MIVDASTGGTFKPAGWRATNEDDFGYYGSYNTDAIIPIYCISGIAYGTSREPGVAEPLLTRVRYGRIDPPCHS